jgi:hypothetical protein
MIDRIRSADDTRGKICPCGADGTTTTFGRTSNETFAMGARVTSPRTSSRPPAVMAAWFWNVEDRLSSTSGLGSSARGSQAAVPDPSGSSRTGPT